MLSRARTALGDIDLFVMKSLNNLFSNAVAQTLTTKKGLSYRAIQSSASYVAEGEVENVYVNKLPWRRKLVKGTDHAMSSNK
jgi:hypothetical protein